MIAMWIALPYIHSYQVDNVNIWDAILDFIAIGPSKQLADFKIYRISIA